MNRKSIVATMMLILVAAGLLVPLSQSVNAEAQQDNGLNAYGGDHDKNHDGFTIQNIICDNSIVNVNGDVNGADTPQTQETPQTQDTPQTLDFMGLIKPIDALQTEDTPQTQDTQTQETPQTQHSMGLLEPKEVTHEQTETDSANIPTGNRFRDGNSIAKDLLCLNQNNNNNGQNGEPTPPPIHLEGCEGCFITLVSGSATNANALISLLETQGIQITLGAQNPVFHSLINLCTFLDVFAFNDARVQSAVTQIIQQLENGAVLPDGTVIQANFTPAQETAFLECLKEALNPPSTG